MIIGYKFRDWIPIGISAALLFSYLNPFAYLTTAISLISFINFSIVGGLLCWADGYEREPARTILWAILWGGFVAIAITLLTTANSSLFIAAVIEEASKLLGLFWIFKRGSIHSATDALVMGGFIGLGFTIFEDFTYSAGTENAIEILIYRGIYSVFAHTLFSGIGAAIMFTLWKKLHSSGAILGFIISYIIHFFWNFSLNFDLASFSLVIHFVVYALWPPVILVVTCILVRRNELAQIRKKSDLALSQGLVTPEVVNQIIDRRARKSKQRGVWSLSKRNNYRRNLAFEARKILELNESAMITPETESYDSVLQEEDPWN